jgi:hypothetical protein
LIGSCYLYRLDTRKMELVDGDSKNDAVDEPVWKRPRKLDTAEDSQARIEKMEEAIKTLIEVHMSLTVITL